MDEPIGLEFQRRYANVILELEKLNKDLNEYLTGVQEYCQEGGVFALLIPRLLDRAHSRNFGIHIRIFIEQLRILKRFTCGRYLQIAPDNQQFDDPAEMKRKCEEEAENMVNKSNITMVSDN